MKTAAVLDTLDEAPRVLQDLVDVQGDLPSVTHAEQEVSTAELAQIMTAHYATRSIRAAAGLSRASDKAEGSPVYSRGWYRTQVRERQVSSIDTAAEVLARTEMGEVVTDLLAAADILSGRHKDPAVALMISGLVKTPKDAQRIRHEASTWAAAFLDTTDTAHRITRIEDFVYSQNHLDFELMRSTDRKGSKSSDELRGNVFANTIEMFKAVYAADPDGTSHADFPRVLRRVVQTNSLKLGAEEQPLFAAELFRAVQEEPRSVQDRFSSTVSQYGRTHVLTAQATDALIANVLPRIRSNDPSVSPVSPSADTWAFGIGEFGLGDFVCHSYSREATPANLNELLMVLREIPTSSYARLEQNRHDGLRLVGKFGSVDIQDLIHDERPGVHALVSGMVDYYTTHNPTQIKAAIRDNVAIGDYFYGTSPDTAFMDLNAYDEQAVTGEFHGKRAAPERVIDVLRRLAVNTEPVPEDPPKVSDVNLHLMLEHVTDSDERSVRQAVSRLTNYLNGRIESMIEDGVVGIEPSFVEALAWTERRQYHVLQAMTYEDQMGLAKQDWFRQILRFHELTHAPRYDKTEFNEFMQSLNSLNDIAAARAISTRASLQARDLMSRYETTGQSRWVNAVGSGDVTHELMAMLSRKPAVTAIGRRLLAQERRDLALYNTLAKPPSTKTQVPKEEPRQETPLVGTAVSDLSAAYPTSQTRASWHRRLTSVLSTRPGTREHGPDMPPR
jgi:hypothetical protein